MGSFVRSSLQYGHWRFYVCVPQNTDEEGGGGAPFRFSNRDRLFYLSFPFDVVLECY